MGTCTGQGILLVYTQLGGDTVAPLLRAQQQKLHFSSSRAEE